MRKVIISEMVSQDGFFAGPNDEVVWPVILGGGKTLFGAINDKLTLTLLKTETFNSGSILFYYQPDRQ